MRRQLVAGGAAVVALTLLLFAVPLAFVVRSQLVASGLEGFAGVLEQTATLIDDRSRTCAEVQVTLTALAREDVAVTVFDRDGVARFVQRSDLAEGQVTVAPEVVARAAEGATGSALLDGAMVAAVPLSTTVCGDLLVLQGITDGDELGARVHRAWLVLGIGAVAVLVFAGAVAAWLARRLAEPMEALAASARELGEGDFTVRAPRSQLPEVDAVASSLDSTAERLGRAVARGTAFAADAGHQLRTPLTALRLHVEQARAEVEAGAAADSLTAALDEADRLEHTIGDLIALTRLDQDARPTDLSAMLVARGPAWRRRARLLGRDVEVEAPQGVTATVRPAAVAQALEVLVDNALQHGRGTVAVTVVPPPPAAHDDRTVRVRVADEGGGLPAELDALGDRHDRGGAPLAGGRGLPLARDLVEAEGGRLVLGGGAHGAVVELLLPCTAS